MRPEPDMPERTCVDCPEPTETPRSIRCRACKAAKNRERVADWQERNRDSYNAKSKRWYAANSELHQERTADWKDRNPEKVAAYKASLTPQHHRNWGLRYRYGITLDQQHEMIASQGGRCPLCAIILTPENLAVDHNHDTGKVRGVLCRVCNRNLSQAERDPSWCLRAFDYLT